MQVKQKIFASLIFVAAVAAILFNAPVVAAQNVATPTPPTPTPTPVRVVSDDEVNVVARELYCPVCSNVPLDVCSTQACADWREVIRQKLAEGKSAEQIKMYFAQRYGDRVLPVPPNPLIYIIPGVILLIGALGVARAFFWRGSPSQPLAPKPVDLPANDPYIARLEAELEKRKKAKL